MSNRGEKHLLETQFTTGGAEERERESGTMADCSLETLLAEVLGPISSSETASPLKKTSSKMKLCPIAGCNRSVKCLWNHMFQYHKKAGK